MPCFESSISVPGLKVSAKESEKPFCDASVVGHIDVDGGTLEDASLNVGITSGGRSIITGDLDGATANLGNQFLDDDVSIDTCTAEYSKGKWTYMGTAYYKARFETPGPPVSFDLFTTKISLRDNVDVGFSGGPIDPSSGEVTGTVSASGSVTDVTYDVFADQSGRRVRRNQILRKHSSTCRTVSVLLPWSTPPS